MSNSEIKAFENMMGAIKNLMLTLEQKKVEVREFFVKMPFDEMKAEMRLLDSESLTSICALLEAVENENYEICQCAMEILSERNNK